jgi:hypothetical protein
MAKKWKQVAYEKDKLQRARESGALGQSQSPPYNNNNIPKGTEGSSAKGGSSGGTGTGSRDRDRDRENHPWGPSSPTEGTTAPSPPPSWLPAPTAGKVTVLFNGKSKVNL